MLLAAGCFWRSYGRVMATHAEVLVAIGRKGVDLVASARMTAETMPELTYPLERAQVFARAAAERSPVPPASLAAFERLLARYRDLVDAIDQVRREPSGAAARARLAAPLEAVQAAADEVRAALGTEGRLD